MEKTDNSNLQSDVSNKSIQILEAIKKEIENYNSLNPNDKLVICKEQEKKNMNDVRHVHVCSYYNSECDNELIGLFKRSIIRTIKSSFFKPKHISERLLYKGINSDYIGMRKMNHRYYPEYEELGFWFKTDSNKYVVNCELTNEIGFDDLRLKMYGEGLIGSYELGKATDEEVLEVLKYAREYFELEKPIQKRK